MASKNMPYKSIKTQKLGADHMASKIMTLSLHQNRKSRHGWHVIKGYDPLTL